MLYTLDNHLSHNWYNTLTDASGYKYTSDSVIQVGTSINFWFQFVDKRRETILKSLSYHSMLTKLKRSAHLVEF